MPINFHRVPTACFVLEGSPAAAQLRNFAVRAGAVWCPIILALKGFAMFSAFSHSAVPARHHRLFTLRSTPGLRRVWRRGLRLRFRLLRKQVQGDGLLQPHHL